MSYSIGIGKPKGTKNTLLLPIFALDLSTHLLKVFTNRSKTLSVNNDQIQSLFGSVLRRFFTVSSELPDIIWQKSSKDFQKSHKIKFPWQTILSGSSEVSESFRVQKTLLSVHIKENIIKVFRCLSSYHIVKTRKQGPRTANSINKFHKTWITLKMD